MNQFLKKSILCALVLFEFAALSVTAAIPLTPVEPVTNSYYRPRVTFSFEIARRRDCTGFGICNLTFEIISNRVNACTGTMYADETSRNTIIIEIDKAKGISAESYSRYFGSGVFVMEDETPLPNDFVKALGLSGTKVLQAGNHKINESNGRLYVAIPVR